MLKWGASAEIQAAAGSRRRRLGEIIKITMKKRIAKQWCRWPSADRTKGHWIRYTLTRDFLLFLSVNKLIYINFCLKQVLCTIKRKIYINNIVLNKNTLKNKKFVHFKLKIVFFKYFSVKISAKRINNILNTLKTSL